MATPLNLLLVEDSQDDADMVVHELRRAGFDPKWKRVETEPDFLAGIKNLPDIILSDYSMPQFNGLRAAELLQASGLDIPFILISGTIGEEAAVEAMKRGVADYLLKDRLARLGVAVAQALGKKRLRDERQQVEASLSLFRALIDRCSDSIQVIDPETTRFLDVNETTCERLGYQRAEMLAMGVLDIDGGDLGMNLPAWRAHVEKTRQSSSEILETRARRKDGSTFPVEVNVRFVKLDREYMIASARDITERKQAEAALHELSRRTERRERILTTTLSNLHDFAYIFDRGGRFVFANQPLLDLWGIPLEAAVGKNFFDLKYPDELAGKLQRQVQEVFDTRQSITDETPYTSPSGQPGFYEYIFSPAFAADGTLDFVAGSTRDITARKLAEEELKSKTAFLEAQVNSSPDGMVVVNRHGKRIFQNQRFTDLWKTPQPIADEPDDAQQLRWCAAMVKNPGQFMANMQHLNAHPNETGRDEIELKDGRFFERYSAPVIGKDGEHYGRIRLIRDITERKKLESQLVQSQKMETVGKLAGGIAHEFNSILTAIIGQSELLLNDLPVGSPLAKNATEITNAAERAAKLTRQLLAYGRKQILQPEMLDLNRISADMEGVLRHLLGVAVDVQIVPVPGLKAVKADAGQIEQVIMNLAINARDAMPNGGKLTLETANISFGQDSVGRYPELKPGDYVMLAISDNGTGMSAEVKARAFEPFFSTKGVGQGTGLGLSTCYGIIKQSGGHISVYSELGRGTTFKIYLPQAEAQAMTPAPRLDAPALPRGTETVLLVEDDPALREMAATLLRRLGYTVFAAANGVEALSLKNDQRTGHVDLLFTDVVMPHMSGKELADRVRALSPQTKILFTSAYTENAIAHQGVLDKGVALLQKPFTPAALANKLRAALEQRGAPKPDEAWNASASQNF